MKEKKNKKGKGKFIILQIIIVLVTIICTTAVQNVIVNNKIANKEYLEAENTNSELLAKYIQKGVTLGGITGTLEALDTSDATATPEDLFDGNTAYVDGERITGTMKRGPEAGNITGNESQNTEVKDSLGNKVVVPAGFKVVNPYANVEEGIVIEDINAGNSNTKGSQFVWVPVGKIQTTEGEKEIILDRHLFDDSGNPIAISSAYKEETKSEHTVSGKSNSIAKDIDAFKRSVEYNGGYYIGRYEAGDATAITEARTSSYLDTNPIVCRIGVYPYNEISQPQAATLCQNMYNSSNFTSDLVNSYAWDTALKFIQQCSDETTYSIKLPCQTTLVKCGDSTDGVKRDKFCNIYDMSSNTTEWTTETGITTPDSFVSRGGYYNSSQKTSARINYIATLNYKYHSCRPILYL